MKKLLILSLLLIASLFLSHSARAENIGRDLGLITRGVGKTVGTAVAVPFYLVGKAATLNPFKIVGGVINGTAQMMRATVSGGTDVARGGAPYAKYMVFA